MKRFLPPTRLGSWFCASLFPVLAAAACPAPPDSLGTAEVTAQRLHPGLRAALPAQRLDTLAFRLRGLSTLTDALRQLAGLNLRDYGGAGGLKTVSVRGLGAAHTAVAFDGLCLNDDRQGQIDLQRYALDRLEAVELQQMGQAELLCPVRNVAAAAVVSLTSADARSQPRPLAARASLRGGSFGAWHAQTTFHLRPTPTDRIRLGGEWYGAQNDYPFRVENGVASERLRRNNSEMQGGSGDAKWVRQCGPNHWEAQLYGYHSRRNLPGQVTLYVNENHELLRETSAFGQTRYHRARGPWETFAAFRYHWQQTRYRDTDAQYPGGELRQHYHQRETYATGGAALQAATWLRLAYATDLVRATLGSNLATANSGSRAGWLQALSLRAAAGRWELTARAVSQWYADRSESRTSTTAPLEKRTQHHHALTPAVALRWAAPGRPLLSLRAGWQRSFRLPTFSEAHFYHLGSKSLKPERATQWNAGLTLQAAPAAWWPLLTFTADVYRARLSDRIVSVPYTLFVWRTTNMGRVDSRGVDATLGSTFAVARGHRLTASANYSYQRVADHTSRGSDTYGHQLAYTPLHSGAAAVGWESPWLTAAVNVAFAAPRWSTNEHLATTRLPAYSEWGVSLSRTFAWAGCRLAVRADLRNAFDTRYEIVRRYPMPGRAYALTLELHF